MEAKYILAMLAGAFLIAGILRLGRDGASQRPQSRAWLLVGVIFTAVSAWLFSRG